MKKTIIALLGLALALPVYAADEDTITVYSARKEHLIKPLFDTYSEKTGVQIRYITDKAGPLLARLKAEGANTPADMMMTVDAGNLWQAAKSGARRPTSRCPITTFRPRTGVKASPIPFRGCRLKRWTPTAPISGSPNSP